MSEWVSAARPRTEPKGPSLDALIQFCRAGGMLTLSEWVQLCPEVRDALAKAGEERAAERDEQLAATIMQMLGEAIQGSRTDRDLDAVVERMAADISKRQKK